MITIPKCKEFIDRLIIEHLEKTLKVLTIADLGLSAKQTDVTKVKALIQARIEKLR